MRQHLCTMIAICCGVAMPLPVAAAPFSDSMAECAALYQNAAQWVRSDENAGKLIQATRHWADAAIVQAQTEGIADAEITIWALIDQKTTDWEAKGALVFATQDFRDWSDYCRSFAADRGIVTGLEQTR